MQQTNANKLTPRLATALKSTEKEPCLDRNLATVEVRCSRFISFTEIEDLKTLGLEIRTPVTMSTRGNDPLAASLRPDADLNLIGNFSFINSIDLPVGAKRTAKK